MSRLSPLMCKYRGFRTVAKRLRVSWQGSLDSLCTVSVFENGWKRLSMLANIKMSGINVVAEGKGMASVRSSIPVGEKSATYWVWKKSADKLVIPKCHHHIDKVLVYGHLRTETRVWGSKWTIFVVSFILPFFPTVTQFCRNYALWSGHEFYLSAKQWVHWTRVWYDLIRCEPQFPQFMMCSTTIRISEHLFYTEHLFATLFPRTVGRAEYFGGSYSSHSVHRKDSLVVECSEYIEHDARARKARVDYMMYVF